ncbi:hypothetical protein pb186bvf_010221 [Paramecium bursaria]
MEDLLTQLDRDIEQLYQKSLYDYNKKDNYKAEVQKICKVIDEQLQEENQLTKKYRVELYYLKGKVQDIIPSYSKQAEESLTKAMKLNPQHCESMNILGHILWKKKDYVAAKQCFEQVLEKDPKNLKALQYLSVTLRQTWDKNDKAQQFERSLITAKQALLLDLSNSHSWYLVGNAYLSNYFQNPKKDNQSLKQALSAYNKSEQYQQFWNPDLLFNRATIHSYYEDYQLSFKDLREALKIDEDLVKDHLQRLEQKLLCAQDLIQNKCKISQKKLINIIKQIPLGLKHPPQNLNKNVKIVQLSDLQEGVNVDKILACKSLQAYTDAQTVPAGFVIVDAKQNFGSLSIYHITQEIYDRIKDNTDLYIIDPVIKTIMCTINEQIVTYQSVQVTEANKFYVENEKILDKFAPSQVVNETFEK